MSADLVVFDPAEAPRDGEAWREWYERINEDDHPEEGEFDRLSPALRSWYDAMTKDYPDFIRTDNDHPNGMDYSLMGSAIHCVMPRGPGDIGEADKLSNRLVKELGLGTYDVMSDDGREGRHIVFPDGPLPDVPKPPSFFSKLFGKGKG
ncbi:hypothetical protein [Erythrobacter ani]|uniref:Uncharacterized protein n=1 Tax=Erythrobacter ani TaxID=2827235 RepID=A0ABS6SPJ1_9SPHN|nr:hypothetical protein [Erythrobacter ani]MBV7266751.1 hypothetical protein [Erythrobacter ani]